MQKKYWLQLVITILLVFSLSSCGFVTGQLKDRANEGKLLKSGSLDVPIIKKYETYSYKILNKYQVNHDWLASANPCHYKAIYSKSLTNRAAKVIRDGDIYEADGHTYQEFYQPGYPERSKNPKFLNIDRYTRSEWTVSGYQGKPVTNKGFAPICGQVWAKTNHSLSISLVKLSLDAALKRYTVADVPISKQLIGTNIWTMQTSDLEPPEANSYGADYLAALLPIGDTGYTFVFKLKANKDSLNYPQIHAQMQQIFKHLIESVKVEPLSESGKK
jgi:hypothetical protein